MRYKPKRQKYYYNDHDNVADDNDDDNVDDYNDNDHDDNDNDNRDYYIRNKEATGYMKL